MSERNRLNTRGRIFTCALLALGARTVAAAEPPAGAAPANTPPAVAPAAQSGSMEDDFAVGSRPAASRFAGLEESIADLKRSVVNAGSRMSTQSDDVDITQYEVSADIFFKTGTHRLSPAVLQVEYEPDNAETVTQKSAGLSGNYRFNDSWAVTGAAWANKLTADDMDSRNIGTYDVYVTVWPNDLLRFDFDVKREIFDNTTSLRRGITMQSYGISMDVSPSDPLKISVRVTKSDLSDDNGRFSGEVEAVYRLRSSPTIDLGVRAAGFEFDDVLNNGYFNPENYQSVEAMFRWRNNLSEKVAAEFSTSGGVESADPGGSKPLVKASLQLSANLTRSWALDGGIAYFSSRESNSSGFKRTTFKLGLHYKL